MSVAILAVYLTSIIPISHAHHIFWQGEEQNGRQKEADLILLMFKREKIISCGLTWV